MSRTLMLVATILMLTGCQSHAKKARKYYEVESGYAHVTVTEESVEVTVPQAGTDDIRVKTSW